MDNFLKVCLYLIVSLSEKQNNYPPFYTDIMNEEKLLSDEEMLEEDSKADCWAILAIILLSVSLTVYLIFTPA